MALPLDAILDRLGAGRPTLDLAGLSRLYAAWCDAVPFDNVQKLLHLSEGRPGPLPGSTAEDFFARWLEHRTGGTCWAGNGALHALLEALGFEAQRAAATMMAAPDTPPSNHGSVVVTLGGERWLTDASILSGVPLRLPEHGRAPELPRVEVRDGRSTVMWRSPRAPDGFPCRIDRVGLDPREWDALHQRTAAWGPFNFAISARLNRGARSLGVVQGQRFAFDAAGRLSELEAVDRRARDRLLVEELGMTAALVARLPDDRSMPPAPA